VEFIYFSSESLKAKAKGFPWLTNGKTELSHFENIYAKKSNSQQSLTQAWFDGTLMETSNKQKESVEQGSIPISNAYPTFKNWWNSCICQKFNANPLHKQVEV
jgi:hypothetical protein